MSCVLYMHDTKSQCKLGAVCTKELLPQGGYLFAQHSSCGSIYARHCSCRPHPFASCSCKGTIDDIYLKLNRIQSADHMGSTQLLQDAIEKVGAACKVATGAGSSTGLKMTGCKAACRRACRDGNQCAALSTVLLAFGQDRSHVNTDILPHAQSCDALGGVTTLTCYAAAAFFSLHSPIGPGDGSEHFWRCPAASCQGGPCALCQHVAAPLQQPVWHAKPHPQPSSRGRP